MAAISTPVPASTPLGDDQAPGGALRSYTTIVDASGNVLGVATAAAQSSQLAALLTIGTRRYAAPLARVAVTAAAAASAAMPAGTTEVMLHASTRCFVRVGGTADNTAIPLEAGEKFHMRVSAGDTVSVIRDAADGFLNIVPVAP
jgi:hypothetical protein